MKKHFVEFYSPGTFVSEVDSREIDSWDIEAAQEIATSIVQRYNARPYGFRFVTMERLKDDFEPKEIERSGIYYLGGMTYTLEELRNRNNPRDKTAISNMEINGWERVIENTNSYSFMAPLLDGDTVLPFVMPTNSNKEVGE